MFGVRKKQNIWCFLFILGKISMYQIKLFTFFYLFASGLLYPSFLWFWNSSWQKRKLKQISLFTARLQLDLGNCPSRTQLIVPGCFMSVSSCFSLFHLLQVRTENTCMCVCACVYFFIKVILCVHQVPHCWAWLQSKHEEMGFELQDVGLRVKAVAWQCV